MAKSNLKFVIPLGIVIFFAVFVSIIGFFGIADSIRTYYTHHNVPISDLILASSFVTFWMHYCLYRNEIFKSREKFLGKYMVCWCCHGRFCSICVLL
jgi:hypothetical protein